MMHRPTPDQIEQAIELIGYVTRRPQVDADDTFESLGLDNIDRISIGIEIEMQFSVELSDHEVFSWQGVGDIAETLRRVTKARAA